MTIADYYNFFIVILEDWKKSYTHILIPKNYQQGQPEGIFCIGYNITEFVDTQSRLDSANNQLSAIAFMQSHLVRKPLANIIGLSKHISEELKDEKTGQLCAMLLESADELDQVVMDISDKTDE